MAQQWAINWQTEKRGKLEERVLVKHIRFIPGVNEEGEVRFRKLGWTVLTMHLQPDNGDIHVLTWSGYSGGTGTWKWRRPDRVERPVLRDAYTGAIIKDRYGSAIIDKLGRSVVNKGEVDTYHSHTTLTAYLGQFLPPVLLATIMNEFALKLARVGQRSDAASRRKRRVRT
jgi:hypothetical protein